MDKENEIFIGRTAELSFLEKLYNSRNFEMLILHGAAGLVSLMKNGAMFIPLSRIPK